MKYLIYLLAILFLSALPPTRQSARSTKQIINSTSNYTLTSNTSLQKLFNSPTNGSTSVEVASYYFTCEFAIDNLSSTSNAVQFGFTGTSVSGATARYYALSTRSNLSTTAGTSTVVYINSTGATNVTFVNTLIASTVILKGIIRITTSGTLIPSIAMTVASSSVVQPGANFTLEKVGQSTIISSGEWN